MKIIQAPNRLRSKASFPSLFIAGGVSGPYNWHKILLEELKNEDLIIFNPKREKFDISDEDAEIEQISWEYLHIAKANAISFWFPAETLCPITLFELGAVLGEKTKKPVFIGCDPSYSRIRDIKIQVGLRNKKIEIVESLSELASQIKDWTKANQKD